MMLDINVNLCSAGDVCVIWTASDCTASAFPEAAAIASVSVSAMIVFFMMTPPIQ
jgi:hypothetical protein